MSLVDDFQRMMSAALSAHANASAPTPAPPVKTEVVSPPAPTRKKRPSASSEKRKPRAKVSSLEMPVARIKEADAGGGNDEDSALDSDTSSDDENAASSTKAYINTIRRGVCGEHYKAAQKMKISENAVALYSEVLDGKLGGEKKIKASDFEIRGADKNASVPVPLQTSTTAQSTVSGEDLSVVSLATMKALGVVAGESNRELYYRAAVSYQKRKGQIADPTDAKEIRREAKRLNAEDTKANAAHKWTTVCGDREAVAIAGDNATAMSAHVRNRVEARSADERDRREAVDAIVAKGNEPVDTAAAALRTAAQVELTGVVDAAEVKLSGTGCVTSTAATTPATGTAQRERVEGDIRKLQQRKVVVSETTRVAKLATSVPPAVSVQGRRVNEGNSMDIVIMGDGSTVQTPLDFALEPLIKKSQTGENLIHAAVEDLYMLLTRSVKNFYSSYEIAPADSQFRLEHVAYTQAYKHRVYQLIDEMFPPASSDGQCHVRRTDLRRVFENLFAGMPDSERKRQLMAQLESGESTIPGVYDRDALVDAVLIGAPQVAATENDVHKAAQRSATQWQAEAEIEALSRHVQDISNDEIAEQMSYNLHADKHVMLQAIRAHAPNDVLYAEDNGAPITLRRETETIYGNGGERDVLGESQRIVNMLQGDMSFLKTLRQETTRDLKKAHARFEELIKQSNERMLTPQQDAEVKHLRGIIESAKAAAAASENEAWIRQLGHADGAATVAAIFKATELKLEVVTREYVCSQFLREPLGSPEFNERPCSNDYNCICSVLASSLRNVYEADRTKGGFVCREFLLPSQLETVRLNGSKSLPEKRQFCYLCHLYQTSHQFFARRESASGGERMVVLQKFQTIFDKPGEYSSSQFNLASVLNHRSYGIVAPFPAFNAANYQYGLCKVKSPDGAVHTLRQMIEMPDQLFH
jgi:hypothetical protein